MPGSFPKEPDSAKVKFDGAVLRFPGFYDTPALDQVRAGTRFLAKKLLDRTGEQVTCVPVISLPGWYVETLTANSEVIVCNLMRISHRVKGAKQKALKIEGVGCFGGATQATTTTTTGTSAPQKDVFGSSVR